MEKDRIDTHHIDILDGVRAYSVIIVMLFHFWQQSWYNKTIYFSWFDKFGIKEINFEWLWRTGYVFVDMMILISGFLLFLPYARHMVEGTRLPGTIDFYKKRAARIIPSYWFCVLLLLFAFVIPFKEYWTIESLKKDLFAQLTFTQMFDNATKNTIFNGVLWTVSVEVQLYIIFPLLAYAFRKKPVITYFSMVTAAYLFIQFKVLNSNLDFMINQMPAFLGVYANGMMGALVFVNYANNHKREKYSSVIFTVISVLCLYMIRLMLENSLMIAPDGRVWQVEYRYILSLLFCAFVVSAALSAKWFRFIFSNRVARFLSTISFNLYIWHALVAIKLKYRFKIPHWEGDTPPNQTGDRVWMLKYLLLILAVSFVVATIMTYALEKPCANLLLGKHKKKAIPEKVPVLEEEAEVQIQ